MRLFGGNKEELLDLIKELDRLHDETDFDKRPDLWSQMQIKTHELISKLQKAPVKTFNKLEEDSDTVISCSPLTLLQLLAEEVAERNPEQGIIIAREASKMLIDKQKPETAVDMYVDIGEVLIRSGKFNPALAFLTEAVTLCDNLMTSLGRQARDEMKETSFGPIPWGDYAHLAVVIDSLREKKDEINSWIFGCQVCTKESVSKGNIQPILNLLHSKGLAQRAAALRLLKLFGNQGVVKTIEDLMADENDEDLLSLMEETIHSIGTEDDSED
jgi:hypothetical protein